MFLFSSECIIKFPCKIVHVTKIEFLIRFRYSHLPLSYLEEIALKLFQNEEIKFLFDKKLSQAIFSA